MQEEWILSLGGSVNINVIDIMPQCITLAIVKDQQI
jgi:hypothetical protein